MEQFVRDGLTSLFVKVVNKLPELNTNAYIKEWYRLSQNIFDFDGFGKRMSRIWQKDYWEK